MVPGPLQGLGQLMSDWSQRRERAARLRAVRGLASLTASSLAEWAETPGGSQEWRQQSWEAWLSSAQASRQPPSGGQPGGAVPSAALTLPCALRPAVGPRGLDLQLRLFQLHVGDPWEAQAAVKTQQQIPGLLKALDCAAGLLAARLLFPTAVAPVVRLLAGAYCASAAAQAAGLLLPPATRAAASRRLRHAGALRPLAGTASRRLRQLSSLLQRYGEPAFVLLAAAALWAHLHPSSAQIGECIAALIPVLMGYNQTARHCATLGLSGNAAEELWRKRHKWAARRTAALLSGLPESPPLSGLASTWEAVSICIGATFGGMHFGSVAGVIGGTGGGGGLQLWASVGLRSQQSRHQQQETLAVVPGHVAAAPAQPLDNLACGHGAGHDSEHRQQLQPGEVASSEQPEQQQVADPSQPATPVVGILDKPGEQQQQRQQADGEAWQHCGPAGAVPAAVVAGSCSRSSILDSPSEMCGGGLPVAAWGLQAEALPAAWQQEQQQQLQLDGSGRSDSEDFMHPSHWAAARQAAATSGHAAAGAHSSSTSSVAGDSGSCHSFLLPGRTYSSSEASSEVGLEARHGALSPGSAQLLPPGLAQPGATGRQMQQQCLPAAPAAVLASASEAQAQQHERQAPGSPAAVAPVAAGEGVLQASPPLPLYGRGDHAAEDGRTLTLAERLRLVARAAKLLAVFSPFLLLGTTMLLLASRLDAAAARRQHRGQPQPAGELGGAAAADGEAGALPTASRLRTGAFKLLLGACRRSGPAFIKWGQWASTREDIFPPAFCAVLSELHDRAPTHPAEQTRRTVEAAFGRPLDSLFVSFEPQPLASGSIAQVHRARMLVDGRVQQVAVKVRHPGVASCIWMDFQLLRPLAALTARVRSLRSLNLSDSVSQFSHTMTAQADLRVEAEHLRRFYNNFRHVTSSVHVPQPIDGYCTEEVLVESYEAGASVAAFIHNPHPQNTQIVALGVDTYLKMLLQDNFVHTDLHPGNILVRPAANGGGVGRAGGAHLAEGGEPEGGSSSWKRLELVLLDFGLAEELTPAVRHHFISFLHMIAKGDGRRAAEHLLQWSANQRCPDRDALTADMEALFQQRCNIHSEEGINLDAVMKAVLHLARRHEVSIDSNYAALVVGVCVIVGFATSLDRRVNLMDAATPCFLFYSLIGRVSGRLYM